MKNSASPYQERQRLSEQSNRRGRPEDSRAPVTGTITEQKIFVEPTGVKTLRVKVRVDRKPSVVTRATYASYYPLEQSMSEVYLIHGDEIVGKRCKIEYFGPRENTGVVYIIEDRPGFDDPEAAATLPAFGTLLAPAGSFF
jgi:hypothetical protein